MRLTIINQFYVPDISPTAHLCASLAQHRAAQGDEVTIVTSRGGYVPQSRGEARSEREGNPAVYRVWTPQLGKKTILMRCIDYGCFYVLAFWRMIALPKQDVVVSLTTPPYIAWTAIIHRILHPGARVALWNMDCYPELAERSEKMREGGLLARCMRAMNRTLFRRLDHLICLDSAMVELLLSQYTSADQDLPVTIIPNWEDAALFPADSTPTAWQKSDELGLKDQFVILYLGNMGYGHEFGTVLDAAEQLRDKPVKFLFVGGGSRFDPVAEQVRERNLPNVVMHGYVPKEETASVMAAADCALITLRDRILGVMSPSKLHSNLAMRLPVLYIGPKGSNVDDAIEAFDCGVSLRHGDVDDLVNAITQMMEDSERFSELQHNARHAFDHAYSSHATLPRFDAVLESMKGSHAAQSEGTPQSRRATASVSNAS